VASWCVRAPFAATLATVVLALGVSVGVAALTGAALPPLAPFYLAVFTSAAYGGLRSGLLALALSGGAAILLWFRATPVPAGEQYASLALFLGVGLVLTVLTRGIGNSRAALSAKRAPREHPGAGQEETAAALLQTLFVRLPVAFAFVSPELRLARVNDELCRLAQCEPAQLLGREVSEVLPGLEPSLPDDLRRVLETGHSVARDLEARTWDGGPRWFHANYYRATQGDRILGAALVLHDVTERRRSEDALRESEERFRLVARAAHDAVRDWDVRDNTIWWSDALATLFGYAASDVEPTFDWWIARIHENDQPEVLQSASGVSTGTSDHWTSEYRFRRADGSYAVVQDRGFVLRDEAGRPLRVIGAMSDVTAERNRAAERRALLERERAARAEAERVSHIKDEFLATLSHELRTPLNAMLGWCELLLTGRLDAAQSSRAIEIIRRNAQAQARLIGDLLDMSRIITGRMHLEVATTDLGAILAAAIETVRPAAEARQVRLVDQLEPGVRVNGDPARLQQVAWNLLSNAVKFTPEGGQVTVTAKRAASIAHVTVTDTGLGIQPSMVEEIFDRFRQLDVSPGRRHGGLGLGLAIVRHLVELHGGTVAARSGGEDQGATFTVSLPLAADVPEEEAGSEQAGGPHPAPSLRNLRVLVVEDEPDSREWLAHVLEDHEARVFTAESVEDALEQFEVVRPDVLVSDIAMPDHDGYDLIRAIRARPAERGGLVAAIALTAFGRAEDRQRSIQHGFHVHLTKPVKPWDLATTVARLAGEARPFSPARVPRR
jgi:PAS domain S-box-containing protein